MTTHPIEVLRGEMRQIEGALDESERRVEHTLGAAAFAALVGMLAVLLVVVFSLHLAG
ncbi:MAG: hypothetical protein L0H79_03240 [Intrasporangium sp.]|uniref:hypothetical protein n=1 Tax=Intrasporangium sp. TaxID=1925024 RepID=UPI00264793DD|nr:hypothetical protein [Intrasporangium sp.]MDN5794750.1 hypothetical protein [Intrasporangium sp.]